MIGKISSSLPAAVRSVGFKQLFGATLVAAAAATVPAHATTIIDFEDPSLNGPVGGGEGFYQGNELVAFFANAPGGGIGNLVGQYFNGDDSSCDSGLDCPANSSGTYYGALNDSYIDILSQAGLGFQIKSFDASFIGGNGNLTSYPATPGLIRVQGFFADGTYLLQTFALNGPTATGFKLDHFDTTGAFATSTFVEALVFGYACNTSGSSCTAFNTDRGQFAIDNIALNEVPEPATAAIVGLGLLGLGAARRRKA